MRNDGAVPHALRIAGADGTFDTPDDVISNPAVTSAGARASVGWQTPDVVTAIPFRCDIHLGMTGAINLK